MGCRADINGGNSERTQQVSQFKMQPIMSVRILWDVVNASGLYATAHAVLFGLIANT